jgi:hypothetical protein
MLLLSGSVPNPKVHLLVINCDYLRKEIHAGCHFDLRRELFVHETIQDGRFPNEVCTKEDDFALGLIRGGWSTRHRNSRA